MPSTIQPEKAVYTTGEVAKICQISQQTVIRCFDKGRLKGYRVPGSRTRKIPRDALTEFMRAHDIPVDRVSNGRRRVLVVDDDEPIVEMFEELLARDGRFELRTAMSGFDAGLACDQFRPELIVLDYKLPDINGDLICRRIRSNADFGHPKIIIVSGVADPDEIASLRQAGADDFVKKPFDIDSMIQKFVRLLNMN